MFTGLFKHHLAPLVLRLGLAAIFIYHGWEKVSAEGGTAWGDKMEMPIWQQFLVAWGEFLGGIAMLIGLMSRVAAAGFIIIMLGAIATVHGAKGFSLAEGGFEYNLAIIAMSLAVVFLGSGAFSADHYLWQRRARGPS